MSKLNRFIQFNDETIEAKSMILYEGLVNAGTGNPSLELTERKLIEFQVPEQIVAMSVFWRHRDESTMHHGRLSDIYLIASGLWRHFDLRIWHQYKQHVENHHLSRFAHELLMMLEEFRIIDQLIRERPGMARAFQIRKKAYVHFHRTNVLSVRQKDYVVDALLSELFIILHDGIFSKTNFDWEHVPIHQLQMTVTKIYDSNSTEDSSFIALQILALIETIVKKDLTYEYYAFAEAEQFQQGHLYTNEGIQHPESGTLEEKQSIEEAFHTWHEENEQEQGVHLEQELDHGISGNSSDAPAQEGSQEAEVQNIAQGTSKGDHSNQSENTKEDLQLTDEKVAGKDFGSAHTNVVFTEYETKANSTFKNTHLLQVIREQQKPYVRSIIEEMKKRIDMKQVNRRENLLHGRLSSNLLPLFVDERPKPFYRKNGSSIELDAVFGLLVDGSASMIDKLEETQQAVLLFHDVLRTLHVMHEIVSYSEDAFIANQQIQPNSFEIIHGFTEQSTDSGLNILSFDAKEDNRDGFAIRWMTKRLTIRPEKHKFLLVFSDGEPSAYGYQQNGIIDTAEAVREAENQGVSVIHLYLATEEPTEDQLQLFHSMYGSKSVAANHVAEFTNQTIRILKKLLTIVIQAH